MRWLPPLLVLAALLTSATAAARPDIQHWRTDSGARVYFVAAEALPIVDLRITFDGGSARDGDTPGLARLTNNLLLEGTVDMDAGEIARRFERQGARISTDSGRDMATVSLRSLSRAENLDPVAEHLAEVLAAPAFPESALNRVRQQMLVGLRQARQSPDDLADRAFARALYREHPYASPPSGTEAGLKAIDRAAVQAFHTRYYTASNAVIAIVGDVDRQRAAALAERVSAGLPAGDAAPPLPPVPALESARIVRVPLDTSQVHVLMGQPGVARGDPDYFALYLANHVLGGNGLVSILAEEMREKRGLSYSSYSGLNPAARKGRFELGTQVRADALPTALEVLRDTLGEFHAKGPSEEQLEASKQNITGSFPLNLDSNRDLVGYVATIGFYDLPLDYLESFRDRIEALTRQEVTAAFQKTIHPQRLVTVLVGPKAAVEALDE